MRLSRGLRTVLFTATTLATIVAIPLLFGVSPGGLRLLCGWISASNSNLELSYESGHLAAGRLTRFTVKTDASVIEAINVQWQLAWDCVWRSTFCVDALTIDEINIGLVSVDDQAQSADITINLPFAVETGNVRIRQLVVRPVDQTEIILDGVEVAGVIVEDRVRISKLKARQGATSIVLAGEAVLSSDLPFSAQLQLHHQEQHEIAYIAAFELQGNAAEVVVSGEITAPEIIRIEGAVSPQNLSAVLQLTAPGLLPRRGSGLALVSTKLGLRGDWPVLHLDLQSQIVADSRTVANLNVIGVTGASSIELESIEVVNEFARWSGSGSIKTQPDWSTSLEGELAVHCAQADSITVACKLSGPLALKGDLAGDQWVATADGRLKGVVEGRSAEVSVALARAVDGVINVNSADARIGENHLQVSGSIGEEYNLAGELSVVDVKQLRADLGGTGSGLFSMSGPVSAPLVRAELQLNSLSAETLGLQNLAITGEWQGAEQRGWFSLDSADGNWDDLRLSHARIRCDVQQVVGNRQELACAEINFNIVSDQEAWQSSDTLKVTRSVQQGDITLEPFCLFSLSRSICSTTAVRWNEQDIDEVALVGENLDLNWVRRWLPPDFDVRGAVGFSAYGGRSALKGGYAELVVTSPYLEIGVETAGKTIIHPVSAFNSAIKLTETTLSIDWSLLVGSAGSSNGEVVISDWRDSQILNGSADLKQVDVAPFMLAAPGVWDARSLVSGLVSFDGTLSEPVLTGNLQLMDGYIDHETLPQALDSFHLDLEFVGAEATMTGGFSTAAGGGAVTGNIDWLDDDWIASLHVKATDFELEPLSGSQIRVSPTIEIALSPSHALITGYVDMPYARIMVDELPRAAVSVSQDTVIFGETNDAVEIDYQLDLDVRLGEDVLLFASGASSQLAGHVNVLGASNKPLEGSGTIDVLSGRFVAYGQKLEVTQGQFMFSGPLDQPSVRLEAVRPLDVANLEVGVRVSGAAKRPDISLFSSPTMEDNLIMYYLLTGAAPAADVNLELAVATAMMQMGLSGATDKLDSAAGQYGIRDIQLGATQKEEGTQVDISAYLSPQLYVRYGISTFDRVNTLRARYRVRNDLFIEAISGASNAIDILYAFDW